MLTFAWYMYHAPSVLMKMNQQETLKAQLETESALAVVIAVDKTELSAGSEKPASVYFFVKRTTICLKKYHKAEMKLF